MHQSANLYEDFGEEHRIGGQHYRAWVGPPSEYDLIGALQFQLLTRLGMRENNTLLDIGCGSLRGGRLSIMYLRPGNYFGIEPEDWVLADGINAHLGQELRNMKRPTFSNDRNFTLSTFHRTFDFLVAHSIFTHAAGVQIARCMKEASKVMGPNSIFIATFHEGEKNHQGDEWVYPDCTWYTKPYITGFVEQAGLRCQHVNHPHPFNQKWIVVTRPEHPGVDWDRAVGGEIFSYSKFVERTGMRW